MKTLPLWIALSLLLTCEAQAQSAVNSPTGTVGQTATNQVPTEAIVGYQTGVQDGNSRVWQKIVQMTDTKGNVTYQTNNAYTELATGLNHLVNGQWVASSEEINIAADGNSALATNGQHQAYFPGDIYSGQIELVTPDGKQLLSRPVGLSYDDGTQTVLIAELTNATGQVVGNNQVLYTNAFTGLAADIRYTYTKAGLEQDIILREQPPAPASFGLNPDTTKLQVLTEFFNPPQPNVSASTVLTAAGDLEDDNLNFGSMMMGRGKAFLLGTSTPNAAVEKQWVEVNGRQFLMEEVPTAAIANQLENLPLPQTASFQPHPPLNVVSTKRQLPEQRLVTIPGKHLIRFARIAPSSRGLVLDYNLVNGSLTNLTFKGDTTYYVSGGAWLYDTTTIEGGTVIKFGGSELAIDQNGTIVCKTGPYRPGTFTSTNDNSVGETISGSSGSPQPYDVGEFMEIYSTNISLHDLRFNYAGLAMEQPSDGSLIDLTNCQFVGSDTCVSGYNVGLYNVLISRVWPGSSSGTGQAIILEDSTLVGENVTADGGTAFSGPGLTIALTNCLITSQSLVSSIGSTTLITNNTAWLPSPTSPIFKTFGAGSYYLTNGSVYRDYGTTNIDPALLAELRQKTTYPPSAYTNVTVTNATWAQTVPRDTNSGPDLGYHYDPIDYAVGNVTVSGTLTLSNGVSVAVFNEGSTFAPGIRVNSGDQLTSVGTATLHNQIFPYAAVQEQPILWGDAAFKYAILVYIYSSSSTAVLYGRFTDFNGMAGLGTSAEFAYNELSGVQIGGGDPMEFNLRDCHVGPGWLSCATYQGSTANLCVNNLFERGGISISDFDGDSPVTMLNNLFHDGYVAFDNENLTYSWTVENNFFDNDSPFYEGSGGLSEDHNGYWNTTQLTPTNANDVVVTSFNYATGPLGSYYQGSTNLLYKGSTTAGALGLFHYTVQTNMVGGYEIAEGTNTVSIGFHYVATDQYGNPLDSNGDGIPDYLEDANGNGLFDSGDLADWERYGLTASEGLQVFTPLK